MTHDEIKEYLLRVRRAEREAARYTALKQQAERAAAAQETDFMTGDGAKRMEVFARYAQYVDALDEKTAALLAARTEAVEWIDQLPDGRYRELLLGHYVQGQTWEQVAHEMGYTYQNVVQFLHPKALDALGKIITAEDGCE